MHTRQREITLFSLRQLKATLNKHCCYTTHKDLFIEYETFSLRVYSVQNAGKQNTMYDDLGTTNQESALCMLTIAIIICSF